MVSVLSESAHWLPSSRSRFQIWDVDRTASAFSSKFVTQIKAQIRVYPITEDGKKLLKVENARYPDPDVRIVLHAVFEETEERPHGEILEPDEEFDGFG